MQCCRAHPELHGGGRDGFAGSHESDCSQANPAGNGRGMDEASQRRPNLHTFSGNQTMGQVITSAESIGLVLK